MSLSDYETTLLEGWEDTYKKSQLTLWVLLALKDGHKYMAEIKEFMHEKTNGTMQADDKSMYRALRRFEEADLIAFSERENPTGPKQKIFRLTKTGRSVLSEFVSRNIVDVLFDPDIKKLLL